MPRLTGLFKKRPNIFAILMVVAGAAFAVRLVNIVTFSPDAAGLTRSATAEEEKTDKTITASDAEAPPLTAEEVKKAVAATANQVNEGAPSTPPAGATVPAPPAAATSSSSGDYSASEIDVLQSLAQRREELDQRERNLNESAAMLKAAETEIDRKVTELNNLKSEIESLLGQQQKMEEARIVSLVKIYESMKPKEAATIFNTLDMDVLLAVVGRMNERRLSPILASMDPEKARIVTIKLAEQRQLPGSAAAATTDEEPLPAQPEADDSEPVSEPVPE